MAQQSFLEDPGDFHGASAASAEVPDAGDDVVSGKGESADGMIRVSVDADGRIDDVHLAPELLRRGPGGTAWDTGDTEAIAGEITVAVNTALDDLANNVRARAGDVFDDLETELSNVTAEFDTAIDQVRKDIEQARKRLES